MHTLICKLPIQKKVQIYYTEIKIEQILKSHVCNEIEQLSIGSLPNDL